MTQEKVIFRYIATECCGAQLCWVNPRLPNYCPECGKHIFPNVKGWILVNKPAWLSIER